MSELINEAIANMVYKDEKSIKIALAKLLSEVIDILNVPY